MQQQTGTHCCKSPKIIKRTRLEFTPEKDENNNKPVVTQILTRNASTKGSGFIERYMNQRNHQGTLNDENNNNSLCNLKISPKNETQASSNNL